MSNKQFRKPLDYARKVNRRYERQERARLHRKKAEIERREQMEEAKEVCNG